MTLDLSQLNRMTISDAELASRLGVPLPVVHRAVRQLRIVPRGERIVLAGDDAAIIANFMEADNGDFDTII